MKEYLYSIFFMTLLTLFTSYLSSDTAYEKFIRYLGVLLTMLVVLSPLPSLLDQKINFPKWNPPVVSGDESAYLHLLEEESEKQLSAHYTNIITEKCKGLSKKDFSVVVRLEITKSKEVSLKNVSVYLYHYRAVKNRTQISEILKELSCPIDFIEQLS